MINNNDHTQTYNEKISNTLTISITQMEKNKTTLTSTIEQYKKIITPTKTSMIRKIKQIRIIHEKYFKDKWKDLNKK